MTTGYLGGLRNLQEMAPEIPFPKLLTRYMLWTGCRISGHCPVVPVHDRSRMRLEAVPGDHGMRTAIYLLRDAYEPSVRHAIDTYVSPGDTVYDIGANFGLWALRLSERVGPGGRVVAFEPFASTRQALGANADLSGAANLDIRAEALGEEAGTRNLNVPADPGSASFGKVDDLLATEEVALARLDDVWTADGQPKVSFVKMDTEGAEPMVLAGAGEFFSTARPVVCSEVHPERLAALGFAPSDIMGFFADLGYSALTWDETHRRLVPRPDAPVMQTEDIVFLPGKQA